MGSARQLITPETFQHFKALHSHKWKWLGESKVDKGARSAFCECENCGCKRWVIWAHIRKKLSTQCKNCCRRIKDFSHIQKKIDDAGGSWQITNHAKLVSGRRYFLCRCRTCKKLRGGSGRRCSSLRPATAARVR